MEAVLKVILILAVVGMVVWVLVTGIAFQFVNAVATFNVFDTVFNKYDSTLRGESTNSAEALKMFDDHVQISGMRIFAYLGMVSAIFMTLIVAMAGLKWFAYAIGFGNGGS